MDIYTATEEAYKKGYEDGKRDAVVHGQWENVTGGMIELGNCSICKVRQIVIGTNYCINCGARMDGGKHGI